MIKEAKNVDFYTTGRQPSEQVFARISAWIKRDKQKQAALESKPIRPSYSSEGRKLP
jgi:hypothetical protein